MRRPTAPEEDRSATARGWVADAWLPVLVVFLGYVVFAVALLRQYDFNPTGPIRIGSMLPAERFWNASTYLDPGVGYDGQWFFYIAHDPLLRSPDPGSFIDLPAYRYARVLYPALAWLLALGQPTAIPWSMLAVNLLAVVGGTLACYDLLRQLAGSRWLVLGYALSPPILIGVSDMLAEPLSMALVVAGLALALRGRHWLGGAVLACAVLAREPTLLVPLGLGLYALARLDGRRGAAYLLPLAIPAGWHLWVWARLGALPSAQSPANFGVPFGGAYYRLGLLLGWHEPLYGEPLPAGNGLAEAAIVVASCLVIVIGLTKIAERRDLFAWLFWLQAVAALGTSPLVWMDLHSFGRVLGMLYFTFGLAVLTNPRRWPRFPERIHEWTAFVPNRAILRNLLTGPVPSPMAPAFPTLKRSDKQL